MPSSGEREQSILAAPDGQRIWLCLCGDGTRVFWKHLLLPAYVGVLLLKLRRSIIGYKASLELRRRLRSGFLCNASRPCERRSEGRFVCDQLFVVNLQALSLYQLRNR